MTITYKISENYNDYIKLINECQLILGPRFHQSIKNWCKIGERPYPLLNWRIYLVENEIECVGICSYYQEPNLREEVFWLGWLAIRPVFRRKKIGTAMLNFIISKIKDLGCAELLVHTDSENIDAIQFYKKNGFNYECPFSEKNCLQASVTRNSIVLKKNV
jgi:GNAT superfamily N-acetyltransferase